MTIVKRVRDWWLGRLRAAGGVGKVIWIGIPFLFACCGLTMCSALISPPAATPTAEVAERVSTVEIASIEPTEESPTATDRPTRAPTATEAPTERPATHTPRPTEMPTDEPTEVPARAAAAVVATVAAAQPTAAPPTSTSASAPTALPSTAIPATAAPTVAPTATIAPTATLPVAAAPGDVIISSIRYDGDVPQVESDEYAVITNRGAAVVNLNGWRLNAGEPDQNFNFPSFDLQPGQSCRVYTNEFHPETCGFSFGRGDAIWRNSGDCGTLHDPSGAEVSRYCW